MLFHTSFEKEIKLFKIFHRCSLFHSPVACDAIYYSVIVLSGRRCEFVFVSPASSCTLAVAGDVEEAIPLK